MASKVLDRLKKNNVTFVVAICFLTLAFTTYLGLNGTFNFQGAHLIFKSYLHEHQHLDLGDASGENEKIFNSVKFEKTSTGPSTDRFPPGLSQEMRENVVKSVRWMTDLKEPLEFLPKYKNPCWIEEFDSSVLKKEDIYKDNWYGKFHPYALQNSRYFEKWKFTLYPRWSQSRVRVRCLPYFYLAGIAKCGTTDLYQRILSHPDVVGGLLKMAQWWGRLTFPTKGTVNSGVQFRDFVDIFDGAAAQIEQYTCPSCQKFHNKIVGDYSTNTLFDNDHWAQMLGNHLDLHEPNLTTAHYMRYFQPDAKIIAIFREPAARLYSDYLFFNNGYKSPERFHKLAKNAIKMFEDCTRMYSVRSCAYNRTLNNQQPLRTVRLRVGLYHVYAKDFLDVFPRDQLLFLKLEDYHQNLYESINKVFSFLGLGKMDDITAKKVLYTKPVNTRSKKNNKIGDALEKTKVLLRNFYAKHNEKLAEVLNDASFKWSKTYENTSMVLSPTENTPKYDDI